MLTKARALCISSTWARSREQVPKNSLIVKSLEEARAVPLRARISLAQGRAPVVTVDMTLERKSDSEA